MRVACELHIEAFQALRRTQQQFDGFRAAALVERDAASQLFGHRVSKLGWRLGLDCRQQPERGLRRARITFRLGCSQGPIGPPSSVGREERGPLEEGGGGQEAATGLRPRCRLLELDGNTFVVSHGRVGSMPRTPIGITDWIGDLRERAVRLETLLHRC